MKWEWTSFLTVYLVSRINAAKQNCILSDYPMVISSGIHTIRDIIIDLQNDSQDNFWEQFFHGKLVPR